MQRNAESGLFAEPSLFISIGLMDIDFQAKPALAVWDAFYEN